jgi:hypothetical protein
LLCFACLPSHGLSAQSLIFPVVVYLSFSFFMLSKFFSHCNVHNTYPYNLILNFAVSSYTFRSYLIFWFHILSLLVCFLTFCRNFISDLCNVIHAQISAACIKIGKHNI